MRRLEFAGALGGAEAAFQVRPPLVTLIMINWNYASYVGAAIDSILAQDYPLLDLIVVDNGSTDGSADIIKRHLGDDPRCKVIVLDTNLGQLGAFFQVFDEIQGDFVTIVDADDILKSNFVSSHVQVHIALSQSVALTSNNVFEINAEGRVITGGYGSFGNGLGERARDLPPEPAAPRLHTISDREYSDLAEATSLIPSTERGWFWGPGTANMYRRSVLDVIRQRRGGEPYLHAADTYLNTFCHALGGSALIHQQLSFYRLHDANYFAVRESTTGMRVGRPEIETRNELLNCETIEFMFRDVDRFVGIVGRDRFWEIIDQISMEPLSRRFSSQPYLQKALAENFSSLRQVFGEKGLIKELHLRLGSNRLHILLRSVHDGRLPLKQRRRLLRISAQRMIERWRGKTPRRPLPTIHHDPKESPREMGPVAVLSLDPPVFKSGMAYDEVLGIAGAFGRRHGNIAAGFIIYPTWTIETPDRAAMIAAAAAAHRRRFPRHQLIYLGNTQRETELLSLAGQPAIFLNKNFTVSESIFRPLAGATVEFDAVYNARFDPIKRHNLAAATNSVAYLGYAEGTAERRQQQRDMLVATLARNPSHRLLNPIVNGLPVRLSQQETNAALNRAAVGLCLSEAEGSNYASMEYMLAGLPLVSTPSSGGRDVYFDPEYCLICEPNAKAVRDAVETLKARRIPREHIRARTLARIESERRRFLTIIDDVIENLGGRRRNDATWPYGEVSGMVAWNTFENHLSDFDRAAGITAIAEEFDRAASITAIAEENAINLNIHTSDVKDIQLQPTELRPIVRAILSRPRCSLLVFGCGNDSVFWEKVNRNGTTAFLEDNPDWLDAARSKLKTAEAYLVHYDTKREDWHLLLNQPDKLQLDLPPEIASRQWDVVLVDGPAGYMDGNPGRMKSIFAASKLVAPGGCVFVHDCDRPIEREYAARYLGKDRLIVEARGRSVLNGYAF